MSHFLTSLLTEQDKLLDSSDAQLHRYFEEVAKKPPPPRISPQQYRSRSHTPGHPNPRTILPSVMTQSGVTSAPRGISVGMSAKSSSSTALPDIRHPRQPRQPPIYSQTLHHPKIQGSLSLESFDYMQVDSLARPFGYRLVPMDRKAAEEAALESGPSTTQSVISIDETAVSLAWVQERCKQFHPETPDSVVFRLLGYLMDAMEVMTEPAAVFAKLQEHVCSETGADRCILYLLDDGTSEGSFSPRGSAPAPPVQLLDVQTEVATPLKGIPAQVVALKKCITVDTPENHPNFDEDVDPKSTQAALYLPVFATTGADRKVIGVLVALHETSLKLFSPFQQAYLQVFASVAVTGLIHARTLYRASQEGKKATILLKVARDVSKMVTDSDKLVAAVMENARQLTNADRCALFLVDTERQELDAWFGSNRVRMPIGAGIAGHVATHGETVNIAEAYDDPRFNRSVDMKTGYRTKSILCMPVKFDSNIVAVAQLVNKQSGKPFSKSDEMIFDGFAAFAGISLRTAQLFRLAEFERQKSQAMLELAHAISSASLDQEDKLVNTVVNSARQLIGSDRCSLFLCDHDKHELEAFFGTELVRMPMSAGIAGHVATTAETVNIPDAYNDPRFNKAVDVKTGYHTTSILCMPIKYESTVVAVAQLINKLNKDKEITAFTEEDEKLFITFSMYAGVSIRNARLFSLAQFLNQKAKVMLNLAATLSSATLDSNLPDFVVDNARSLITSDRCALFLVDTETQELEAHIDRKTFRMPIGAGIAGHVATTGETVNIVDAYEDSRFNKSFDLQTGYRTKSILCMPVMYEGVIVAVAQLVNKLDKNGQVNKFTRDDEDLFLTFSTYAGVALRNCRQHFELVKAHRRNDIMVKCLGMLGSGDVRKGDEVIETIAVASKSILHADRCTVFVVDKEHCELYSKVATDAGGKEIRLKMTQGIAGEVATTGKGLNIPNPYEDPRFNPEIDKQLGYVTRCILTMPVIHGTEVVAVIQSVNKTDGTVCFTKEDEQLLTDFCMFAAISVANAKLYQFVLESNKNAMDLLSGNQQKGNTSARARRGSLMARVQAVNADLIQRYRELVITPEEKALFKTIEFNIFDYKTSADENKRFHMIPLLVSLFVDLGVLEKFNVSEEVLYRFLLYVMKLYRNVPYHNFYHAADATQFVYMIIKMVESSGVLDDLDKFVLLVTATLHDVDHMGLNNSFHLRADTPMGILSSAAGTQSVLEVHHSRTAVEILSLTEVNVFATLSHEQGNRAFRTMIDCILATDMAKHKDILNTFAELMKTPDSADFKSVLLKMIIHTADLSNVAKPFNLARQWGIAVTEEFHRQGDLEAEQGMQVAAMFDRSKGVLARDQMGFIDFVAIQHYSILVQWNAALQPLLDNVKKNRESWKELLELSSRASVNPPAPATTASASSSTTTTAAIATTTTTTTSADGHLAAPK